MHFFAQPPLGANAEAIADDQHPHHQIGIDRGAPHVAVERLEMRPHRRQVDEAVDLAEQVIGGDMPFQAEAVEKLLLHRTPLAHHRPNLLCPGEVNQPPNAPVKRSFSTLSAESRHDAARERTSASTFPLPEAASPLPANSGPVAALGGRSPLGRGCVKTQAKTAFVRHPELVINLGTFTEQNSFHTASVDSSPSMRAASAAFYPLALSRGSRDAPLAAPSHRRARRPVILANARGPALVEESGRGRAGSPPARGRQGRAKRGGRGLSLAIIPYLTFSSSALIVSPSKGD